jgi:hypothetical protein
VIAALRRHTTSNRKTGAWRPEGRRYIWRFRIRRDAEDQPTIALFNNRAYLLREIVSQTKA